MIYELCERFFEISEMDGDCEVEHYKGSKGNFYEPGEPEAYFLYYDIIMRADINELTDKLSKNEIVELFKSELLLSKQGYFEEFFGEDFGKFLNSFNLFPEEVYDIELCNYDIFEDDGYLCIKIHACVQGMYEMGY